MKLKSLIQKRNYKTLLLFVFGMFLFSDLSAQTPFKVKGKVIESDTKDAVIGATIRLKDGLKGTMTDVDGNFEIEVPSNATLVISFIGFDIKEVPVNGASFINVELVKNASLLSEVVVIGYGQVKKSDATGSVLAIKPDQLNKGLQVNAQEALMGKMAGVNIVPASGAPGSGATIRIRMGASLSASNDPLIVIDGVPADNSSLNSINPNDIETYTVLKDASATAIYGSRASNGVLIITTKKGNLAGGGKPKISYSTNLSLSHVQNYYELLSADEYRDAFKKYATSAPASFQLGNASTDWQKQIYRTAVGHDHNLSLTGSSKNTPYRVSAGYTSQDGIIKENNYQRANGSIGLSPKFLDKHLTADINLKGSVERNRRVSTGVIGSAISFDPTRPVHETYPNNVGLGYYTWMDTGKPIVLAPSNPVADLQLNNMLDKVNRSIGNVALDYKIHGFEDLHLNANFGYDVRNNSYSESIPQFAPSMYISNQNNGTGRLYNRESKNRNYLMDLYATYNKELGKKQSINAMAGYGWQRFWYSTNDKATDHLGKELAGVQPTQGEGELYLLSFFGRLNYAYADKLLVTATLRSDASSRFAAENRWGYFPSVAVGYRLSEENFLKNVRSLSDLKLRVSYGQTGQQDIGSYYEHMATYTASYNNAMYAFGDEWLTVYRPNGYDPNIKWETTSTYNFGLDYGFLNNRIYGSIDVYTRKTKDLLNKIFVPAGSNFTNVLNTNIGDMESKGIELAVSGVPVKTKGWEWTLSGNFTYGTSRITKLNTIDTDNNFVKTGNAGGTGRYLQVHKIGETPYTFFLLQQAYDEKGKPLDGKYIAKDGSITSSEADANKYVTGKSSQIPYYYGLSTRVTHKNWDLGLNGHGSFGNYVYNYQKASESLDDLFSANKVSSNISRATLDNAFVLQRIYSDYFLENGAFFKVDNITLGHSFSHLWNSSSSLRLALSAQNIVTLTKYSGVEPEVYSGIDRDVYQRPRIYTLSLNLNF
jgi:TonB-linked SusC/RagA family outer membrane protein